jgi:tetratricopeptide (TPR) repeat protein
VAHRLHELYRSFSGSLRYVPAWCVAGALLLPLVSEQPLRALQGAGAVSFPSSTPMGNSDPRVSLEERMHQQTGNWPDSRPQDRPIIRRQVKVCTLDPYPGMADTVSVEALKVPSKIQKQYEKACDALLQKKLPDAERELRSALQIQPSYALGWVVLGQTLAEDKQIPEAEKACRQAANTAPSYSSAFLCLAEIAGRKEQWSESLNESNRAIALRPESKNYGYYFDAVALFHLNQVPAAEDKALEAAKLDRDDRQPAQDLRLLLAQIYETQGNRVAAASHLLEFLKYAQNSPESQQASEELARLESGTKP